MTCCPPATAITTNDEDIQIPERYDGFYKIPEEKGHLSLIRAAAEENGLAAVSIFVNPTQFGPNEDYKRYPRSFGRDRKLAALAGADAIFYPAVRDMYPRGYRTYVEAADITENLCGRSRPGHFKGVATVVTKLFNIIRPDIAYFGQKDAQQAIVIKRMVKDLDMGIRIKVMPTIRKKDGLAMSSRNLYLSQDERRDAAVLYQSLRLAKKMISEGVRDAARIKSEMKTLIDSRKSTRIDYISICGTENLRELKRVGKNTLIALAVRVGKTRLIDNIIIKGKL